MNPLNSEVRSDLTAYSALVFPDSVAKQFTRDRKLYYVVEVERRPPKKTPIKLQESGKKRKEKAKTAQQQQQQEPSEINDAPANPASTATDEESDQHQSSPSCRESVEEGEEVRETSC